MFFFRNAGACPPRFFFMHRRAGACPPRACSCPWSVVRECPLPTRATVARPSPFHRRARACPSPCLGRGNGFGWRAFFARVVRSRGTGPRATVCKAVSVNRRARACPSPCLGRNGKRPWVGVRFSRRSNAREGQAPALRAREGFFSPCAVREQVLPNYSHWGPRAIAGDRPPRYG